MKEVLESIFGAESVTEESMTKFREELGKRFVSKTDYNAKAEEVKALTRQLAERDKQLKELSKAAGDNAELSEQIKQLQAENKTAKEQYEAELAAAKMSAAVDNELLKSGALDTDLVKVKLNMDVIKLEDSKLTGLDEQLESVRKNYGYLFKGQTTVSGVTPADAGKTAQTVTAEQFAKMSYSERLKLKTENPETYQELMGGIN